MKIPFQVVLNQANYLFWAFFNTFATFYTLTIIYFRDIVNHMNCVIVACLFADFARNTARGADISHFRTLVLVFAKHAFFRVVWN